MSGLFFLIYFIATSPVLLTIIGVLVVGAIAQAVVKSRKKERAIREMRESLEKQIDAQAALSAQKRELIAQRYEPEIAQRILNHQIWQGMTIEQLMDSAGTAIAVETTVTKTGRKEVWKYDQVGAKQFDTRITLENGIVVGWQKR